MRCSPFILVLPLLLAACDFPKSVGDTEGTTGGPGMGGTDSAETGFYGTDTWGSGWGSSGWGSTGGFPGTASATVTTASPTATSAGTGGPLACGVDLSPVPGSSLQWECFCTTCELGFGELSPEAADAFVDGDLCSCLCDANNCGDVEGEGGVSGADPTIGSGTATASGGETGIVDTDTFGSGTEGSTTGGFPGFTYESCIEDGGVIVGDPGDGSVFDPDYVCPSGESPWGILEFVPGLPFPKNGGVCCSGE